MEKEDFWLDILKVRYEYLRKVIMLGSNESSKKKSFTWWKDPINSDYSMANSTFSFSSNVNFRVGDGMSISFWYAIWVCNCLPKDIFPDLICISHKKRCTSW